MNKTVEEYFKDYTSITHFHKNECEETIAFTKYVLKEQLKLCGVSNCANDFEKDLFNLVNKYCKQGLSKPDLVKKMEWVLGIAK